MGLYKYTPGDWSTYHFYRRVPSQLRGTPGVFSRHGKYYKADFHVANKWQIVDDYVGRYAVRRFRKGRRLPSGKRWKERKEFLKAADDGYLMNPDWARELASYM